MADHPPSWPSCACDRCFAAAARVVIGDALPAIVAGAFTIAAPAARKPRRDRNEPPPGSGWRMARMVPIPRRRKPARRRRPEVVRPKAEPPLVVAPQVDDVPPREPIARQRRGRPPGSKNRPKAAAPPTPTPPPIAAEQVQEPRSAPERTCRVCGNSDPAGWAQADLCTAPACLSAAAKAGRERAEAQRAPRAAKVKRLGHIARIAGRRERFAAQAERAELGGDDDEDLVERLDRIPEVADA